jgi:hypothetical protein
MNTPLETPPDQFGLDHEPGEGVTDAAQRDLFQFFTAPLPEEGAPPLAADRPPAADGPAAESFAVVSHAADSLGADSLGADSLGEVTKANLRRLEATVSWLQSEAEACRMPPAAQLPSVAGLPAMEAIIDRSSVDRTLNRAPPLPAWLREQQVAPALVPPRHGGEMWPRVLKFLGACAVAAPLSYLFAVATSPLHKHLVDVGGVASLVSPFASEPQRPAEAEDGLRMSMAGPESAPAPAKEGAPASEPVVEPPSLPRVRPPETAIRSSPEKLADEAPAGRAQADPAQAATVQPVPAPQVEAAQAQSVTPSTTGVAESKAKVAPPTDRAHSAANTVASQDVKLLIERGKQFFEVGDLIAARILFMRAANAGDAAAAVAMGATYDPVILADRGVRGVAADLDKARSWYERAKEMGSPEGPRRLEMLANR